MIRNRKRILFARTISLIILSFLAVSSVRAATPLLILPEAEIRAGQSAALPIALSDQATNVVGISLSLDIASDAGAPPLTVGFAAGAQTLSWMLLNDPINDPLRATSANLSLQPISGPAEVLKLTVQVPSSASPGDEYEVRAVSATFVAPSGSETDVTARTSAGTITVPFLYGDMNRNGAIDAADLNLAMKTFLGLRSASATEIRMCDVRPKTASSFGDGRIAIEDVQWLLRRYLGLESAP